MTSDSLAWETLNTRIAYSCDDFDIYNQEVRFPSGQRDDFDYLSESEAVVVLPFTPNEDVVVIDQWRQAVERVNRALPAGSIESDDDSHETAARRELTEETGYEAGSVEHLTTVEPANGISDSVFHYFVARDCEPTAEQNLENKESIRVQTMTFNDLLNAVRENKLRDGRSSMAILYYGLFER
jgi:ADP-ribose pyrophosphatase